MNRSEALVQALRETALALPEVQVATACAGTSLERDSYQAGGKAFLFLGEKDGVVIAMVKLDRSLAEAHEFAAKAPRACKVGAFGWVRLDMGPAERPPLDVLRRWLTESYGLVAPKRLAAMVRDKQAGMAGNKKATKKSRPDSPTPTQPAKSRARVKLEAERRSTTRNPISAITPNATETRVSGRRRRRG